MNEEKVREVFSDEEFVKSLLEMETPEEVQAALEEKNINFSIDEIKNVGELLKKKADGELADEDLASVAGGSMLGVALLAVIAVSAVGSFTYGYYEQTRKW